MRRLPSLILWLASCGVPAFAAPPTIDLDRPSALQAVREHSPADYEKVVDILRDAARLPPGRAEGWLRTAYGAELVSLDRLLLVSYPAKRRLAFSLGGSAYAATVTVVGSEPQLMQVR